MKIDAQSTIALYFSLSTASDGQLVDSHFEGDPAVFDFGNGDLLPAFEQKLIGLQAGDEKQFVIPAVDAFGEVRDDNIHQIPLSQLAQLALQNPLVPGLMIQFDGADQPVTGVIKEVESNHVVMDFNHPLAGQDILFRVKIVEVSRADNLSFKSL